MVEMTSFQVIRSLEALAEAKGIDDFDEQIGHATTWDVWIPIAADILGLPVSTFQNQTLLRMMMTDYGVSEPN